MKFFFNINYSIIIIIIIHNYIMSDFISNFINEFENFDEPVQNEITEDLVNYLIQYKNQKLFKEIEKFILNNINGYMKDLLDDFDLLENKNITEKKQIVTILDDELDEFDFYFVSNKFYYMCEIKLEIRFKNFEYSYRFLGCTDGSIDKEKEEYKFYNEKINMDNKKIIKQLFTIDSIRYNCLKWMNKYNQIDK